MDNVILQKRSTTVGAAPTTVQLQQGEIAINVVDGAIFIKSSTNTIENLMSYMIADGGEIIDGTTPVPQNISLWRADALEPVYHWSR